MISNNCCVCQSNNAKYKCPKCREKYCTVICCNKHKENCTRSIKSTKIDGEEQNVPKTAIAEFNFPTEDTVPIEKLEQLRYNEEVKNCLMNPQVRDIIKSVLQADDPTQAIAKAMMESVFVEFADSCLKVVEVSDDDKPC